MATTEQQLAWIMEPIILGERFTSDNTPIISANLVSRLYQLRQFQPLWTDKHYATSMLDILKMADDEGLDKDDYHYSRLLALQDQLDRNAWQDKGLRALFDVLLTDGLISYSVHMLNGKINPSMLDKTWNYDGTHIDFDITIRQLEDNIRSQTVAQAIAELAPKIEPYQALKYHLARYRDLANRYPFEAIPYTDLIKPGADEPALASSLGAINERLTQLGYDTTRATELNGTYQPLYDDILETAIRQFQADHSLKSDGIIGKRTMAALNVPYRTRVEQIRVNLERARWLSANLKKDFLVVNLAGYELQLFKDNVLDWRTDIIIGKIDTQTPLFKSQLKYLVINPTWTVPRSINKEIIEHVKKTPDYLRKKHFILVDSSGEPANTENIDWQTLDENQFPYWFVQQAGVENTLGQVKFIFPNQYAIYLHDTPSKNLFNHIDRAFSHGCIRVKEPLILAERLLNTRPDWQTSTLYDKLASGATEKLFLKEPLDILIMYWTVTSHQGKLRFYNDVYQRDPILINALNQPTYDAVSSPESMLNLSQ